MTRSALFSKHWLELLRIRALRPVPRQLQPHARLRPRANQPAGGRIDVETHTAEVPLACNALDDVANDFEQAVSRVFAVIRRIVEASPLLRHEAKITSDRISFPALDATIVAIASDAASAAGGNPTISTFDELWGYTS
jgi:hypothetical protein